MAEKPELIIMLVLYFSLYQDSFSNVGETI